MLVLDCGGDLSKRVRRNVNRILGIVSGEEQITRIKLGAKEAYGMDEGNGKLHSQMLPEYGVNARAKAQEEGRTDKNEIVILMLRKKRTPKKRPVIHIRSQNFLYKFLQPDK